MGTTLSVIILIVLVIAAGLMRDSLRTGAVNRWGKARGFMPVPTAEHDRERLIGWAERLDDLLASADRARALFTQAAARMSPTR